MKATINTMNTQQVERVCKLLTLCQIAADANNEELHTLATEELSRTCQEYNA